MSDLIKRARELAKSLDAKFWLLLGRCPACHYDAPHVYSCKVCGGRENLRLASKDEKADLYRRHMMAKCRHGYPMEDTCWECVDKLQNMRDGFVGRVREG